MPQLIQKTSIKADDPAFLYLNLHPEEEVQYIVRHHWGGFIGTFFIVVGMVLLPAILLAIIFYSFPTQLGSIRPIMTLFVSGFTLFILTFLFGAWINFYYDILFITNKRILNVDQKGLFARSTSELPLRQVQNVSAEVHGFLQTALSYGTLVIETAGSGTSDDPHQPGLQGYFTVTDLPDPNFLARTIIELHHEVVGDTSA